jgi:hypothetical protein
MTAPRFLESDLNAKDKCLLLHLPSSPDGHPNLFNKDSRREIGLLERLWGAVPGAFKEHF